MTIIADTPDALAFDDTITAVASTLGALGDPDPLDIRRARAVGILADPQKSLNLLTRDTTDGATPKTAAGIGKVRATLHLHLDPYALHALTGDPTTRGKDTVGVAAGSPVATEERYGALTLDLVKTWLDRADQITLRPVLHTHATTADGASTSAAGYTVPPVMAEQVRLRDHTCVFPHCTRPARNCDLDHITAYDPDPEPEDPVQDPVTGRTHPDNLAPLCRRHHRIKTHGRWRYQRNPDGSYTWTSPTGRTYTVDPSPHGGTRHPDQPRDLPSGQAHDPAA
jgi:hypothetical protein